MSAAVSPSSHTVDWLRRLIGYQTVSGSDSNAELIEFSAAALQAVGFNIRLTGSPDGLRLNLLGAWCPLHVACSTWSHRLLG